MLKMIIDDGMNYLKTANIYIKTDEDTVEMQQNQLYATRLFLILFLMSLIGLVGYASLTSRLSNAQIKSPSQSTFEKLYVDYSAILTCPCSQTSIKMRKFVNLNVSYHQVCSSIFVSDEFITLISNIIPTVYYPLDIRRMISSQLQSLASQCRLSQVTVTETFKVLLSNKLFVPQMMSREAMNLEVDILVNEAKRDAISQQEHNRKYLRSLFHTSLVFTALSNNFFYMNIGNQHQGFYSAKYLKNWTYPPNIHNTYFRDSEVCYCTDSSDCIYPSGIYPNLTGSDSYEYYGIISPSMISSTQIEGLYVGCMPYEAILHSTLECFYNDHCLSQLFVNKENIQSLNYDINSVYSYHSKIDLLTGQLFIETVAITKNFESFYSECKPIKCIYSYSSKGDVAFVILTILSLIGGLFVALQMISIYMVRFYQAIRRKCFETSLNNTNNEGFELKKIFNPICKRIVNLNLFEEAHRDENRRKNEIISTRIYILLMIIGFIIIVLYASTIPYTLIYTIKSPSIGTYREFLNRYSGLTCECQRTISNYSVFTSFSPRFHQVCSSLWTQDFTVPHFAALNTTYTTTGFVQSIANEVPFYGMRALCSFAKQLVNESITTYLKTTYLSTYLTYENEFVSSINTSIINLKTSLPATTIQVLLLMKNLTRDNQILSGAFTNAQIVYNISSINEEEKIKMLWINPMNESCNCALSSNLCTISRDEFCNYTFTYVSTDTCSSPNPNIFISCYPVDALLASKLECFYYEECIRIVLNTIPFYQNINDNLFPISLFMLNLNVTSRFSIDATALTLIKALAIEAWNDNIDYESYYKNCNPAECFYVMTKNLHSSTAITTVSGLAGGLSVVLKILVPLIVKFIRWLRKKQRENTKIAFQDIWYRHLIKRIREMNFFQNIETDEYTNIRRNQIISTRLYIILWTTGIVILSVYNGLSQTKSNFEINTSSMNVINQYQSENLDEFTCPCSTIVIQFQTFTSLNFTLHQICSSNLISNDWLEGLFKWSMKSSAHEAVLASHFKLLQSICQSANETLSDSINNFNSREFISVNLLTEKQLVEQTISAIEDFQNKTIHRFKIIFDFIIDIILGNQLMSIYGTNWYFIPDPNGSNAFYTKSKSYNDCSCGTSQSSTCIDSLIINNNTIIHGMFIGCLPITSLRLSTLECFYNQTCFNEVKQTTNSQNLSVNCLNPLESSRYPIKTALNEIIDHFMLEEWIYEINYTEYFNACNLKRCSYSIMKRKDTLAIFTNLLGLYGGFTILLKFLAPVIVHIGTYIRDTYRFSRQTVPEPF